MHQSPVELSILLLDGVIVILLIFSVERCIMASGNRFSLIKASAAYKWPRNLKQATVSKQEFGKLSYICKNKVHRVNSYSYFNGRIRISCKHLRHISGKFDRSMQNSITHSSHLHCQQNDDLTPAVWLWLLHVVSITINNKGAKCPEAFFDFTNVTHETTAELILGEVFSQK